MRHTPGPSYGKSLPGAFHAAAARLRVVVWWCQVAPPTMLVTNGRRAFFSYKRIQEVNHVYVNHFFRLC
jgi:hypothetical protein